MKGNYRGSGIFTEARRRGIPYTTVWYRLKRGLSREEALSRSISARRPDYKNPGICRLARLVGLEPNTVIRRIRTSGWSVERALGGKQLRKFSLTHERIIELLQQGKSNKEISVTLALSSRNVRYHLSRLYKLAGCYGSADERKFMVWILTRSYMLVDYKS